MGPNSANSCVFCKNKADMFDHLTSKELEQINDCRYVVSYNAGETIFKQNTACHDFICVTSGLVKLVLENGGTNNLIVGLVKPTEYIFSPGAYVDNKHHMTAVAVEPTTACLIKTNCIQGLVYANPDFANDFIKNISEQVINLYNQISSHQQKQAAGRMADVLIYLSEKIYKRNPVELTVSRSEIAELAGMTKESSIRMMKTFKDDKIITLEGNTLNILDLTRLEAISRTG